jgi:hypothetical protein
VTAPALAGASAEAPALLDDGRRERVLH